MTLRWRIALILAAVALGAFAAIAAIMSYLRTESQLRSGIDETLKSHAAAVNTPSEPGGRDGRGGNGGAPGPGRATGCPAPGSFQPASGAQLVSSSGTVTSCIDGGPSLVTLRETGLPEAVRSGPGKRDLS